MSITAVPLRPIKKGSLVKFWAALGVLAAVGAGMAYAQTDRPGAVSESGLRIETLKAGKGPKAAEGDAVLLDYTGKLASGQQFDSSQGRPTPFPVITGATIPGFSEGLKSMQAGGKYRLHIPAKLGYGDTPPPGGPIPPNADLVFDVELLQIVPGAGQQLMMSMMGGGAGAGGAH